MGTAEVEGRLGIDQDFDAGGADQDVGRLGLADKAHLVGQPVAAAAGDRHAQETPLGLARRQGEDLDAGRSRQADQALVGDARTGGWCGSIHLRPR